MTVFFVRHGESVGNVKQIHQSEDTPLSELGLAQAEYVARRFHSVPVDVLLSSPFRRAQQTAEKISQTLNIEIISSPLFRETKKPSELIGKKHNLPEVVTIKQRIKEHLADPTFRHSDEETLPESQARAQQALDLLTTYQDKQVLVVTHGDFLRILLAEMCFSEPLPITHFFEFRSSIHLDNTGLTVCEYSREIGWRILSLNDRAHLAE